MDPEHQAPYPYPKGAFVMQVLVGYDRLPPALEEVLLGKEEGERAKVVLTPETLLGRADATAPTAVPLGEIVDPGELRVGQIHHIMDESSSLQPFRVVEIDQDHVMADFSQPLAQHPVPFDISIEEVRWATLDEITRALKPVVSSH
jgi:FKBP-type peptidyl-prolyl cis-trans isomerase 2